MNDKFLTILLLLNNHNDWLTSQTIALQTGFSQRSIKSYIQQINSILPKSIISSIKGYRLNNLIKQQIFKEFQIEPDNYFQSIEGRRDLLLIKLLKHDLSENIYDLSELLFCSVTTIKNDIKKININLSKYNIKIINKGDNILIIGDTHNKKKAFIEKVYKDSESDLLPIVEIQKIFLKLPVQTIHSILRTSFVESDFIIDDFILNSILLHILLIIEQAQTKQVSDLNNLSKYKNDEVYSLTFDIVKKISKQTPIIFLDFQINALYVLFLSKISYLSNKKLTNDNIKSYIDKDVILIMKSITAFLNDYGNLSIENDQFYIPFLIHLNGLYIRAKTNHFFRNPLLSSIRNGHPYIYELSVSVSNILCNSIEKSIPDDEIAYISLHLANAFNKNKKEKKFTCGLVVPNIRNIQLELKNNIEIQFEDSLYIKSIVSKSSKHLYSDSFDFIISTIPLGISNSKTPIVFISPFLDSVDIKKIYFQIDDLKKERSLVEFKENIRKITEKSLFMNNTVLRTKEEAIAVVSDILVNKGIVKNDFYKNILAREDMSSTAFNNIAIPHTFKMEAFYSRLYIILSDKPIIWNDKQTVNFIFLFAINFKDKSLFYNIFENLSFLFSSPIFIENALKCKSYESFIEFISMQTNS